MPNLIMADGCVLLAVNNGRICFQNQKVVETEDARPCHLHIGQCLEEQSGLAFLNLIPLHLCEWQGLGWGLAEDRPSFAISWQ